MSNGVAVLLDGERYPLEPGESVLEGLERHGVAVQSSCRAGHCQSCMMHAEDPPAESQTGLRSTLQSQGYFLACRAKPNGDLLLHSAQAPPALHTTVTEVQALGAGVMRLRLAAPDAFEYRPGQFVNLEHPDGQTRSYSLASTGEEAFLELHVRNLPGGLMSPWLHAREVGDAMKMRGPFGECFYLNEDLNQPLLLVGAGTGLAPLYGIARDAIAMGHTGPIVLLHGGVDPSGLYYREELQQLEAIAPSFQAQHCVLRDADETCEEGPLDTIAVRLATDLDNPRCFLCGDPGLVNTLRRGLFLGGVSSANILADPFLPSA